MANTQISKSALDTARGNLTRYAQQIQAVLPKHLSVERLNQIVVGALVKNPKLAAANSTTLIAAVIQCAQLHLEPDPILGHAYLVPFAGEVQLIPGYKGLLSLARRSGQIKDISAHVVYENDDFMYHFGTGQQLMHRPAAASKRGNLICAYAVANLVTGGTQFDVMEIEDINKIRDNSPSYKNDPKSPWKNHYEEMCKKTVLRRLCKLLPLSVHGERAVALDELGEAGVEQRLDVSVFGENQPALTADYSVGEPEPEPQGTKSQRTAQKLRSARTGEPAEMFQDGDQQEPEQNQVDRCKAFLAACKTQGEVQDVFDRFTGPDSPCNDAERKECRDLCMERGDEITKGNA